MSLIRIGVQRMASGSGPLSRLRAVVMMRPQVAGICHKDHIDPEVLAAKPKPWPYETKKYTWLHEWLEMDNTLKRFDENTKVIVVEGNIGSGKSQFAKQLAEELGMKHFEEPSLDQIYTRGDGFDYRSLNYMLPEWGQAMDVKMFYAHPHHKMTPTFQLMMYRLRICQYMDAMAHMYNTGQGIVLERCLWSDAVFMNTSHKLGYIPRDGYEFYYQLRNNTMWDLQRPHVVIYLDVPVDVAMKRIKERNRPWEVNSKVMNENYLQLLENNYKDKTLPEMSRHAELLVYDWKKFGDVEQVVEDLEKLNFDQYEAHGEKMEDYRQWYAHDWHANRRLYTNGMEYILSQFNIPCHDVESTAVPNACAELRDKVYDNFVPEYDIGWDPEKDGGLLSLALRRNDNYRKEMKYGLWEPYFP